MAAICKECAVKNDGVWPIHHVATFFPANCDVCGVDKNCCSVEDWFFAKRQELYDAIEERQELKKKKK